MDINKLSSDVIKAAISVHKELGPGLLETVYQSCMNIALAEMGLKVAAEVAVPIIYRGREITDQGFRMDLLVEDTLIVELKSVEQVILLRHIMLQNGKGCDMHPSWKQRTFFSV